MTYGDRKANLLANGFKLIENSINKSIRRFEARFQRKVTDKNGTRYFVEVVAWCDRDGVTGYQWEVAFDKGAAFSRTPLRVQAYSFGGTEWTADDVLAWAHQLWERLAPNYYERTN